MIPCSGDRNIPDGEVFTAPVRDSINGKIRFNTPSRYQGIVYENIEFEFKDGKIVRAKANETEKINALLDSDEGARYCGEWAIGVNNRVREPMLDTLFDEKIGGSFHLTPGQAYEIADNGNRSRIHWDLVLIQRPDYGGGEIWFDGELVRKDGRFVPAICRGSTRGCSQSAGDRSFDEFEHGGHGKVIRRITAAEVVCTIAAPLARKSRLCRMKSIREPPCAPPKLEGGFVRFRVAGRLRGSCRGAASSQPRRRAAF